MTKSEYLLLRDPGKMLEELKKNAVLSADNECWTAMWERSEEIEKQWQIGHFGHYDPDLLFDPLPRNQNAR